jgi:hypothetical protein
MTFKQITCSVNMPIVDLTSQYRRAAEATSNPDPKEANKSHDLMHIYYNQLRQTEEGRMRIAGLLTDESPHVRCWAAAHSLAWVPDQAKAALRALRDANGSCAFDAAMTLREFDKGRLNFEY